MHMCSSSVVAGREPGDTNAEVDADKWTRLGDGLYSLGQLSTAHGPLEVTTIPMVSRHAFFQVQTH